MPKIKHIALSTQDVDGTAVTGGRADVQDGVRELRGTERDAHGKAFRAQGLPNCAAASSYSKTALLSRWRRLTVWG